MFCGLWFMCYGLWFMVHGLWFVVCGLWFVVCGLWFVVYGLGFTVEGLGLTFEAFVVRRLGREVFDRVHRPHLSRLVSVSLKLNIFPDEVIYNPPFSMHTNVFQMRRHSRRLGREVFDCVHRPHLEAAE